MKVADLFEDNLPAQQRVEQGIKAQKLVAKELKKLFGDDFELVSYAGASSTAPDLVANIHGNRTQFEIKNRTTLNTKITLYDRRLGRGEKDSKFDAFARGYSDGDARNFTELMDTVRASEGHAYGWPGDEGVTNLSGKFARVTNNPKVKTQMRRILIDKLKNSGDDYYVIVTNGKIAFYDIGDANKILDAAKLPNIKNVYVDTYGGADPKNRARLGIKVTLSK